MKKSHYLTNPFCIYSISWLCVMVIYQLPWSTLFPPLSTELLLFLIITCAISGLVGIITTKLNLFKFKEIQVDNQIIKYNKKLLEILYIGLIIEFITQRQIPILSYIFNITGHQDYTEFGLPIIHTFIITGFMFVSGFAAHAHFSTKEKLYKKNLKIIMLGSILPGILIINRAILMYSFFLWIILYMMSINNVFKHIFKIFIIGLIILFSFGTLGNLRNGETIELGKEYIMNVGQATPEFRQSIIPVEFFWIYLYISSPLSNLQYTIDKQKKDFDIENFVEYYIGALMPQMISKRIGFEIPKGLLIRDNFNVGSVYYSAYAGFGWIGMMCTFIFMFFFIILTLKLIGSQSPFYTTSIAIIDTIIFFNIFDNMFIFMGLIPALCYPIAYNMIFTYKKNINLK